MPRVLPFQPPPPSLRATLRADQFARLFFCRYRKESPEKQREERAVELHSPEAREKRRAKRDSEISKVKAEAAAQAAAAAAAAAAQAAEARREARRASRQASKRVVITPTDDLPAEPKPPPVEKPQPKAVKVGPTVIMSHRVSIKPSCTPSHTPVGRLLKHRLLTRLLQAFTFSHAFPHTRLPARLPTHMLSRTPAHHRCLWRRWRSG